MNQMVTTAKRRKNGDEERLRADRRLLGRLLGEVIREQIGAGALDLIENIRRAAVIFRRSEGTVSGRRLHGAMPAAHWTPRSTACRSTTRCTSCARSATSCIWSISPRILTNTAAATAAPTKAGQARRKAILRGRWPAQKRRYRRRRARRMVCDGSRSAGAHRAPDRSAAPEHTRLRTQDRAACSRCPLTRAIQPREPTRNWRCAAKCCGCG